MNSSERLDRLFAALADPTRRAILARLTAGETPVLDLARPFRMTQPAVSKHLKVLEEAGLVSQVRQGQQRPRKLEPLALAELEQWLNSYHPYIKAAQAAKGGKP
jgi:DNA-binding transcriptional ArsR family regulator